MPTPRTARQNQAAPAPSGPPKRVLTSQEAADYLGISLGWLYQLTSRDEIAHYKPGGKRLYFLRADLDAYLFQNRSGPSREVHQQEKAAPAY